MAIKDWHGGQLVVFATGAVLLLAIEFLFISLEVEENNEGLLLVGSAAFIATFFVLLMVAWKWFGGKRD